MTCNMWGGEDGWVSCLQKIIWNPCYIFPHIFYWPILRWRIGCQLRLKFTVAFYDLATYSGIRDLRTAKLGRWAVMGLQKDGKWVWRKGFESYPNIGGDVSETINMVSRLRVWGNLRGCAKPRKNIILGFPRGDDWGFIWRQMSFRETLQWWSIDVFFLDHASLLDLGRFEIIFLWGL